MIRVRAYEDIMRDKVNVFVTQTQEDPTGLNPVRRWGLQIRDGMLEWIPVAEGEEPPITYSFNAEIGPLVYGALRDMYTDNPRGVIDSALTRVERVLDRAERLAQNVS